MTVRAFVDTNVVVYAESDDAEKSAKAAALVESGPVISTQVVNETISVLTRKHGFLKAEAYEVAGSLMDLCEVMAMEESTVRDAMRLSGQHALSHWDAR